MNYQDFSCLWTGLLKTGLEEDSWQWDWTSLGIDAKKSIRAKIVAKADGVWAGNSLLASVEVVARELGGEIKIKYACEEGASVFPGKTVAEWQGPSRLVLALERPFLNLACYSSGIATATHRLTQIVRKACPKNPPRVSATRKMLPYYRDLGIYAVQVGGGHSHRVNLSGGVLIKENHIESAGSIPKAIAAARGVAPHGLKVECEVKSIAELKQAIEHGAEVIMLDNFTPALAREAVKYVSSVSSSHFHRPILEISGGITADNIAEYAISGVDVISTGSVTHSVKALDLSLLVFPARG